MRMQKAYAIIAVCIAISCRLRAAEYSPPTVSQISGRWTLSSHAVDANSEHASDSKLRIWQVGTLDVCDRMDRDGIRRLTGRLSLADGSTLQVRGRVVARGMDSPMRIEFSASGSKPNEFGGPPLDIEYEYDGRFTTTCSSNVGSVAVRGLVQAIRPDPTCVEYSVGMFTIERR